MARPFSLFAMNKSYCSAFLAAVAAALLMGTLCLFVRESHCTAQLCSFSRFSLGLVFIGVPGLWMAARGKISLAFSLQAALSGAGISLCILNYFLAIQQTSVGIAALLPATGPLFAAVWESLIDHRLPPRRDVGLILLAGLGILCVTFFSKGTHGAGAHPAMGIFYGLMSGLFYSVYLVLNRRMPSSVSLLRRTFWQSVAGTLILLLPLLTMANPLAGLESGWPYLLGIGFCQGFCVLVLVAYAMRRLTSLEFGIISCLEPTEAVMLGWVVYAEIVMPGQWCGFALVLCALFAKSLLPPKQAVACHPQAS